MNINSGIRFKSESTGGEQRTSKSKSTPKKKRKQRRRFSLNGYKCGYCPLILNSSCQKQRHEAIHTRPYQCEKCSRGFASQSNLKIHIERVHDKELIRKKLSSMHTPLRLPRTSINTFDRSCPVCEQVIFGGMRDIEQHCKTLHPDFKYFKCDNCPFKTADSSSLHTHKRVHTNIHPNKCHHCNASFKQLGGLNRHLRSVHDEIPIVVKKSHSSSKFNSMELCSICTVPIIGKTRMLAHFKLHHPEVKPFKCEKCPFASASRSGFFLHKKLHNSQLNGLDVNKCPVCAVLFRTIYAVNIHIKSVHPDAEVLRLGPKKPTQPKSRKEKAKAGEYKCQYCGKEFNYPSVLRCHEARHTLPFPCHLCDKRFSAKGSLKDHLKTGHRAKPLNSGRLTYNWRVPPMEKCPACSDLLRGKTKLGLHLKLYHPGFKAYKCKDCPFETSRRDALSQHGRLHYAGDFYKCPFCTASFTRDTTRIDHVEKVHQQSWNDGLVEKIESEIQLQPRQASIHPAGYYNPREENFEFQLNSKNEKCTICSELFSNKNQLGRHFVTEHPGLKPYNCSHCPYNCSSIYLLERHEKLHSEINPFTCAHCTASFTTRCSRTFHMKNVHADTEVEISGSTPNEQFPGSHVQTVVIKEEVEEYDDEFGMLSLRQVRILLTPVVVIDSPNLQIVEANEISSKVNNLKNFNSNLKIENFKTEVKNLNSKSEIKNLNAKSNVKNLTSNAPVKCDKCGETFKFTIGLNFHVKKFHKELLNDGHQEDDNDIQLCEVKSEPKSPSDQHESIEIQKSQQERPFYCSHCSYSTFSQSNFRRHVKTRHCHQTDAEDNTKQNNKNFLTSLQQVQRQEYLANSSASVENSNHNHNHQKQRIAEEHLPTESDHNDSFEGIEQDTQIPIPRETRGSLRKAIPYEISKVVPAKRSRSVKLYVCTACKHQFSLKEEFERHVASKCQLKNIEKTETHVTKTAQPVAKPKQKSDQKEIPKINNVLSLPRPVCPLCNETFAVNTDFKTHLLENHGARA